MRPPRAAVRLLTWAYRHDPARPAILGDMHETFVHLARERGEGPARRWYARETLLLTAGRLLRRSRSPRVSSTVSPGRSTMRDVLDLRGFVQDAAWALRSVRRNPGFAAFIAAVIGLGVGAATSVYSILEPLVLAPLPFEHPEALVRIDNEAEPGAMSLSAITSRTGNLRDFRERAGSFDGITGYNAFWGQTAYTLSGVGEPERLSGVGVAHDFLDVLGVDPLHGRGFTAEEGAWGGPGAVLLTHGFWRRRFGGDPAIVGRALTLNDEPATVVGVLPPSFDFASIFSPGSDVDFLVPFPISEETDRQGNTIVMLGRLRSGVGAEAAQAEMDAVVAALQQADPGRWGLGARVTPLQEHVAGPFREALLLLAGAAATLLLIVVVNVSNLLLARSPGRAREVAVRKAFGASRGRLVRQLVLETVGVALVGAAVGGGLAWLATRAVAGARGVEIPLLDRVGVDAGALLFGTALAVITGLLVGLLPALRVAEGNEAGVLRAGTRGGGRGRGERRLRETLVVAEVALACVLLIAGGLLVRSFSAVLEVDLGFNAEGVVAWQVNPGADFDSPREEAEYYGRLAERVREVPGVEDAGLIDALPLGRNRTWGFSVAGVPEAEDEDLFFFPHLVGPGYLPTLRIPLVAGRNITSADTRDAPRVLLMNETAAERVFPGRSALGGKILLWDEEEWEVVGVVRDVRHVSPELGAGLQFYFSIAQMADFRTLDLAVRSSLPADRTAEAVSGALRAFDPTLPTREHWTLASVVEQTLSPRRFTLGVLTAFGATALFLAGLGIYGVLAHSVAERRAEIGIRMALGASSGEVVGSVMGRTLSLAGIGVGLGAVLGLVGARWLGSLLYGVSANDPVTFAVMAVAVLGVAAAAGGLPAARAARTPSVRALRAE